LAFSISFSDISTPSRIPLREIIFFFDGVISLRIDNLRSDNSSSIASMEYRCQAFHLTKKYPVAMLTKLMMK